MQFLEESLIELITQTSTNLPPDVRQAMGIAIGAETPGTQSSQALNIIASNIDMAQEDEGPICQDTGMPTFVVHTPVGVSQIAVKKAIRSAVAEAPTVAASAPLSPSTAARTRMTRVRSSPPSSRVRPRLNAPAAADPSASASAATCPLRFSPLTRAIIA